MKRPLLLLILGFLGLAFSEEVPDTNFQRFGGVPAVAYAEETGWQLGALGLVFFRPTGPRDPGSQLDIAAIFTTKNQKRFVFSPDIALWGGLVFYESSWQYFDWPGKYWSGGNTPTDSALTYNMHMWMASGNFKIPLQPLAELPQVLRDHVEGGLEYDLENNHAHMNIPDSAKIAADPQSYPQSGPTRMGGNRVGLGYGLIWDSRDHDNWPRSGSFAWFRQRIYRKEIGSAWNFYDTRIDLRKFVPTPLKGAWCMSSFWESLGGDVPFDRLAMPDGTYHMRGLEKGRLRDQQQWVLQGEWRVPLFWRFSAASFAEAGKVGPYFSELMRNDFHYAYGIGGRMALNPKRKVNIRGDLSWVDGGIGMTIYFKEAF